MALCSFEKNKIKNVVETCSYLMYNPTNLDKDNSYLNKKG